MKKMILSSLMIMTMSISALAGDKISANKDEKMSLLDLVVGMKTTYSKSAGLDAKVIELLAGDGVNPTRMVLILNNGNPDQGAKIFELGIMMLSVKRITFLAMDKIVINYSQDDLDPKDDTKMIVRSRSVRVQLKRSADGAVADTIEIETK